jgi:phosphatidylglycerol:prolipoprotein diacylglycerol transferase
MLVTGTGMTWYGGAIGGAVAVLGWARHKRQDPWAVCDAFSPALAVAYAVGRIGCHLSGDGDYGPPTDLPWGVSYVNGTVPTPPGVTVHPTPIYEALAMGFVAALLWKLRTKLTPSGQLFGLYLCLVGVERWLMEWWRINPAVAFGMSVAQWSSLAAVAVGLVIFVKRGQAGCCGPPSSASS